MSDTQAINAKFRVQLEENATNFKELENTVIEMLRNGLSKAGIKYQTITPRVKREDSALEKLEIKKYKDPLTEMTDLVAFRVVCYLESDVSEVEKFLANTFEVDDENTVDKRTAKDVSVVGYRSLHVSYSPILGHDLV